jgi:hypothetical protein
VFQVCLQYVALQQQAGEFAFSNDLDQSGGFELFQVVRERGCGHGLALAHIGAGDTGGLGAYLGQDLVATRIGQGFRDQVDLTIGEFCRFRQLLCYDFCANRIAVIRPFGAHTRSPALQRVNHLSRSFGPLMLGVTPRKFLAYLRIQPLPEAR